MNNRIIKFRVWDKARGKWLNETENSLHAFTDYFLSFNGTVFGFSGAIQDPKYVENENLNFLKFAQHPEVIRKEDRFVVQQFTNILDGDGKEIYEGDIIEYFNWCYARDLKNGRKIEWDYENVCGQWTRHVYYPLIGEVKWNSEYQTFEPLIFEQDAYNGNCFANVCTNKHDHLKNSKGLSNRPPSYYKVIGNIFENPNLIDHLK